MLTIEQVKAHSEVFLGSDMPSEDDREAYTGEYVRRYFMDEDYNLSKSKARLLYIHNGRASKMRIICKLPKPIANSEIEHLSEEDIKATIDWERFTSWINRHDDLEEDDLVTTEVWADYQSKHRETIGRNGLLDTIKNKVIDCNKIILA